MGADLILAALVIDKGKQPDFKAGHEAIERLRAEDIEFPDEFIEDDPETVAGLAQIREMLSEALTELEQALGTSREIDWLGVRGATVYVTGGMSYGDSPTDLFETFTRLHAVKGVLRAVGFEGEP